MLEECHASIIKFDPQLSCTIRLNQLQVQSEQSISDFIIDKLANWSC